VILTILNSYYSKLVNCKKKEEEKSSNEAMKVCWISSLIRK